jgi:multiple sugar transport system permease protein
MSASTAALPKRRKPITLGRILLYTFVSLTALVWIVPIAGAIFASVRPFTDTVRDGFFSWPQNLTLDNYRNAWEQGDIARKYWNTAVILVPALLVTLFFSSMVAFVCSRYSWRFNILLLSLFTAGNLLPQQIIIQPLFQFYNRVPLPDWLSNSGRLNGSALGIILIHIAFQSGFCTFVLSNYMKTLPREMYEAAEVDGASTWRQFFTLTLPLVKPALAALAVLEVTWIYNEFFWATVLLQDGTKFPITSSLNNLRGQFFTDVNLVAAGSILIAIPTLLVFFLLRKQFVSGLTMGSTKG